MFAYIFPNGKVYPFLWDPYTCRWCRSCAKLTVTNTDYNNRILGEATRQGRFSTLTRTCTGRPEFLHRAYPTLHSERRGRMGFAVRVRSTGQKYGPTCPPKGPCWRHRVYHLGAIVVACMGSTLIGVLALAGYKRRKSALTARALLLPHRHCVGANLTAP